MKKHQLWPRTTLGMGTSVAILGLSVMHTPTSATTVQAPDKTFQTHVQPVIKKYCISCHSGKDAAAGISFSKYKTTQQLIADQAVWDKVVRNVSSSHMPPDGSPQPPKAQRQAFVTWIQTFLSSQCKLQDPGRVTLRRLNRDEYNNTIHDLTGLDIKPADDFPSDDVGYGFDNIGDVLSVSPLLMEKYIDAAERVAKAAIVLPGVKTRKLLIADMARRGAVNAVDDGTAMFPSTGTATGTINVKAGGTYRIRLFAAGDLAGPELPKMKVDVNGQHATTFEVSTRRGNPRPYEIPVQLESGKNSVSVSFINDYYDEKTKADRNLYLTGFEYTGPLNGKPEVPESHSRIIYRQPTKETAEADAREFLNKFASKAFRRPVTPEESDRLVKVFNIGFKTGGSFEEGMRLGVEAVLASPRFLFRVEMDPRSASSKVRSLNDFELASRLSYFLWSTMPDAELNQLAAEGKLKQPAVLKQQVYRMLQSPKSGKLADNFAAQWLQLRKLAIVDPDKVRFPGIDASMKKDMETETKMFFNNVVQQDRPIIDFLDGKYTFINQRLAEHYGMTGITGPEFRKVPLTGDRGGVLTQASVLLVTSNPTRTSPTKRGKWVLENILGTPPPPPPPGVGDIKDEKGRIQATTLRQLMEEHRKNPICASCHARMDPIGFGLENFDTVGRWRTKEGNFPLDTSGVLPDGRKFRGPTQLKQILLSQKDQFAQALSEKLLTYGLGRGLESYDKCAIEGIAKKAAANNYKFSALIIAIVNSDPFMKRRGEATLK